MLPERMSDSNSSPVRLMSALKLSYEAGDRDRIEGYMTPPMTFRCPETAPKRCLRTAYLIRADFLPVPLTRRVFTAVSYA